MINTDTCVQTDEQLAPRLPELTDILFRDGGGGPDAHGLWRKVISTDRFRHRVHVRAEERWQLSYDRLRALNEEVLCPESLARDPRGLAALHEWTSVVDGATATVAGIHYNLFLGSLLDDDTSAARDLTGFAALTRTGTFLCTERAHGNDAAALETTARYDRERDEFVLHTPHEGAQKFMPNTSSAAWAEDGGGRGPAPGRRPGPWRLPVPHPAERPRRNAAGHHRDRPVRTRRQLRGPLRHRLRPGTSAPHRPDPGGARRTAAGRHFHQCRGQPAQAVPARDPPGDGRKTVHEREHPRRQPRGPGDRGPLRGHPAHLRPLRRTAPPAGRAPQPSRPAAHLHGHRLRHDLPAPCRHRPLDHPRPRGPGRQRTAGRGGQGLDHLAGARDHDREPGALRCQGPVPGERDGRVRRERGRSHYRRGGQPGDLVQGRGRDDLRSPDAPSTAAA